MIDRSQLLADLKPLLREMEADLRTRCDEVAEIHDDLTEEYEQARSANRTGVTFEEWRADLITQIAVAWLLSAVFVRFLEDNALIFPPRISGSLHCADERQGLMRARDERDLYFRSHPTQTDRDYLLAVFDDLAKLPGTRDVFGSYNLVNAYRDWLSGDAAQKLIEFFQKIDTDGTGEIVHDFGVVKHEGTKTRKEEDRQGNGDATRFLGDLYQDLSETARKKYALLQTPVFVEEFILERTLEPAIQEFGLEDFKMIDPACGSGHFLLGSFARILGHWRKAEPGTSDRELVNRALAAVHGVDLNPYAVAIARFRLLLAAMKECQVTQLKDAPNFQFNLACGDSLLHGISGMQGVLPSHPLHHVYASEDQHALRRLLRPGTYHTVVANPPYVTVKDKALNQAYRAYYKSCYREYSLACPFFERLCNLAHSAKNEGVSVAGYVGQITAASFMTREFGKILIESLLPQWDLTHIIDSDKAQIPGHATPTVIIILRNRAPIRETVRVVMGIKKQIPAPIQPANGFVWQAILNQIDIPGSDSEWLSVVDLDRSRLAHHPWSLGGGGAADLKALLDEGAGSLLGEHIKDYGARLLTRLDDVFQLPQRTAARNGINRKYRRTLVTGKDVRDWGLHPDDEIVFPYDDRLEASADLEISKYLWSWRVAL